MRSASVREGRDERIVSFDEALEIVLAQAKSIRPQAIETGRAGGVDRTRVSEFGSGGSRSTSL